MQKGPFRDSDASLILLSAFTRLSRCFLVALLLFLVPSSKAAVIQFEGFAPPGGVVNVNPAAPYSEAGFNFTPLNTNSAVFDASAASRLPGDSTSWFGFAGGNDITMTGPVSFSLGTLQIGASSIGTGVVNATLTGDVLGGGTLSATFNGLTTLTLVTLNWTNLRDVRFSVSTDAGIDNISATPTIPEPGTFVVFGTGLTIVALRRRCSRKTA